MTARNLLQAGGSHRRPRLLAIDQRNRGVEPVLTPEAVLTLKEKQQITEAN
jgi:hypothetical protein